MLGATCMTPASVWRASGGVSGLQRAGDLVAVGLSPGGTLLFAETDLGTPLSELPVLGGTAAASVDGDVLLGGRGDGQILRLQLSPGQNPSVHVVEIGEGADDAAVAAIARQEGSDLFAVGKGRHVHIVDHDGTELQRLGPLAQPIRQLAWAGTEGDVLVAATSGALHLWSAEGAERGLVLPAASPAPQLISLAASPCAQMLAASSTESEVCCWDLGAALGASEGQPLRLREFESQVTCLEWDANGQYLATADGADCIVWDLSDASGTDRSCSMVCCGHEPRTHITVAAFQPNGPLLATASSSGKVALFDCQQFRRGGVLGPVACTRLDQHDDAVTALLWLPSGRLLVGSASGSLVCLRLTPAAQPGACGEAAAAAALAQLAVTNACESTPAAAAVAAAETAAAEPAAAEPAAEKVEVSAGTAAADASAAAMEAASAAAAAAMSGTGGRSLPCQQHAGPSTPHAANGGMHECTVMQYDPAVHAERTSAALPHPQPLPMEGNGRQTSSTSSGSSGAPSRRQRGARGGGGGNRGAAAGAEGVSPAVGNGAPHQGSAGFSASLMHHIQAIRDNPPQGGASRSEQQQLAGWGLGSPSGACVPWMMAGGQVAGGGIPPGAPGCGPMPGGPAGFAAFQAQQTAMMQQRMAAMHQGMPQSPGGSMGMAYASGGGSPRAPAFYGPGQPGPTGIYPGSGGGSYGAAGGMSALPPQAAAAMQQQYMAAATGGMVPAQQMVPAQWMPYMQQMQQWAGTAPGYMVYQHGPHTPGGTSAGGPAGESPHPIRLSGAAQQPGVPAGMMTGPGQLLSPRASGSWGHSGGSSSVGAPCALSPRHSAASSGGAGTPSAFHLAAQLSQQQQRQRGRGRGPGRVDSSGSGSTAGGNRHASMDPDSAAAVADAHSNNQLGSPRAGRGTGVLRTGIRGVRGVPPPVAAAPHGTIGGGLEAAAAAAAAASRVAAHQRVEEHEREQEQEFGEMQEEGNNDDEGFHQQTAGASEDGASSAGASGAVASRDSARPAQQQQQAQQAQQAQQQAQQAQQRVQLQRAKQQQQTVMRAQAEARVQQAQQVQAQQQWAQQAQPATYQQAALQQAQQAQAQQQAIQRAQQAQAQQRAQQQQQAQQRAQQQQQAMPQQGQQASPGSAGRLASTSETAVSVDLSDAHNNADAGMCQPKAGPRSEADGESLPDNTEEGINTVYVGNLPGSVDDYLLLCAFAPFGPVTHVQVIKEKGSHQSRGYGFVSYAHPVYATLAMQQLDQQVLFGPFAGQRIKVTPSKRRWSPALLTWQQPAGPQPC